MREIGAVNKTLLATVLLSSAMLMYGCKAPSHPDDKNAVYQALNQNKIYSIAVAQDRDKGVITLSGIVGNNASKEQAQTIAQNAAPGYSIENNIRVENAGLTNLAKPSTTPQKDEKDKTPNK